MLPNSLEKITINDVFQAYASGILQAELSNLSVKSRMPYSVSVRRDHVLCKRTIGCYALAPAQVSARGLSSYFARIARKLGTPILFITKALLMISI